MDSAAFQKEHIANNSNSQAPFWPAARNARYLPNLNREIRSVIRSQAWIQSLRDGAYESIEMLAEANGLHPKVVRQALRLAFLSPVVTSAILEGRQPAALSLAQIPKLLPLSWTEHLRLLG